MYEVHSSSANMQGPSNCMCAILKNVHVEGNKLSQPWTPSMICVYQQWDLHIFYLEGANTYMLSAMPYLSQQQPLLCELPYNFLGGGTSSVAKSLPACDNYLLYGYKWFSSAIDAQVAFTLARIVDEKDSIIEACE